MNDFSVCNLDFGKSVCVLVFMQLVRSKKTWDKSFSVQSLNESVFWTWKKNVWIVGSISTAEQSKLTRSPVYRLIRDCFSERWQFEHFIGQKRPSVNYIRSSSRIYSWAVFACCSKQRFGKFWLDNQKMAVFADDSSVLIIGTQFESSLQSNQDKMNSWFTYIKLSLNTSKGEVMIFSFGINSQLPVLTKTLHGSDSSKYGGVHSGSKLTLRHHIASLQKIWIKSVV